MKKIMIIAILLLVTVSIFAYNYGIPRRMATLPDWAKPKAVDAIGFIEKWPVQPDKMIWGNLRIIATSDDYNIADGVKMGWVYAADYDPNSSDYDTIHIFAYNGWHYNFWVIIRK